MGRACRNALDSVNFTVQAEKQTLELVKITAHQNLVCILSGLQKFTIEILRQLQTGKFDQKSGVFFFCD